MRGTRRLPGRRRSRPTKETSTPVSFVFVSHAAPDKLQRIKPLVHALAIEGVRLWLDRPGVGDSHFNFDQAVIDRYGIQGLQSGVDWDEGIRAALRGCGAVLVCLSRNAIDNKRLVLQQEVTIAWYDEKIVPCIIDDLPFDDIPTDTGLPDLVRTQSERVDTAGLQQCLDWLAASGGEGFDALPDSLRPHWQPVHKIRIDLAAAMERSRLGGARSPASARTAALLALLNGLPQQPPLSLLQRLYRRSLPDPARQLASPGLASLLRDLEDSRPRTAQLPSPLIEFAERLGRALANPALGQWVNAQTFDDPFAMTALRGQLDQEQQADLRTKATLFVDVDPEVNHQIRWWVHALDPACCTQEQVIALDGPVQFALAQCLAASLASIETRFGHKVRLSVALLLPIKLLVAGLESMPVTFVDDEDLGPTSAALHRRYPVTLHWRQRNGARGKPGKAAVNAWNDLLDTLAPRIALNPGACVAWVDPDAPGAVAEPFSGAAARLRSPGDDAVCVGMEPPPPASARRLQDEVTACLREGIPCFFWFSQSVMPPGGDLRQAVANAFAAHTPRDAPLQVGLLRKTSAMGSPFASLCMVWDMPELMPVPAPFTLSTDPTAP